MSLEPWLGPQNLWNSRGIPRAITLENGNIVVFATANSFFGTNFRVIDPFGDEVLSGTIQSGVSNDLNILDVQQRNDGGFDILFLDSFTSPYNLYLLRVDDQFQALGDATLIEGSSTYDGDGELRVLPDGNVAVAYTIDDTGPGQLARTGPDNVVLRLIAPDGTLGDPIDVNQSSQSTLFLQVASNDQLVFVAWLNVSSSEARGRFFDHDGNPVGDEFSITTSVGTDNSIVIETLSDGSFVVGVNRRGASNTETDGVVRFFGADGVALGDDVVVTGEPGDSRALRDIHALDNGGFVIAWGGNGTYLRHYDSNGTPTGDALEVPDISGGLTMASFEDGRFIVASASSADRGQYAIIDGRMGDYDGDANDNVLFARTVGPVTINGNGGNDIFYGFDQDDTFIGGAGSDEYYGGAGDDEFHDDGGNNIYAGGPGDDQYFVLGTGNGQQFIENAGEGYDTIYINGSFRSLTLPENVEAGVLVHSDNATMRGNAGANRLTGNDNSNVIYGRDGDDILEGLGGDDRLEGDAGDDQLFAGAGNDVLIDGFGINLLDGGDGDDDFVIYTSQVPSAGQVWRGGSGSDSILVRVAGTPIPTLDLSVYDLTGFEEMRSDRDLLVSVTLDQLIQFESIDPTISFELTEGGNALTAQVANSSTAVLRLTLSDQGNSIDDRGNDQRSLVVQGGGASDTVFAGSIGSELFGFTGADILNGGAGDDYIDGGDDGDLLNGGGGNDELIGGSNIDTAIVNGLRADYTVTQTSTGVYEVVGADGTDTLTTIEFLQFDDQTIRLLRGTGVSVNFDTAVPSEYQSAMNAIRDFDGNDLGGDGFWLRIGSADVNGDGDIDQILVNDAIGRFATVGTAPDGLTYFEDYSWAGETRVAGIYIDPLVESGAIEAGGEFDSQRRFQNDLQIENINRVLGADDYDGDGVWEVYFALTDGTAYLRALMHEDGNIRYANYQSEQEVIDYLTANGYDESTFGDWFGTATGTTDTLIFVNEAPKFAEIETFERPVEFHSRPVDEWQVEYFG